MWKLIAVVGCLLGVLGVAPQAVSGETKVTLGVSLEEAIREIRETLKYLQEEWRKGKSTEAANNLTDLHRNLLLLAGKKKALATFLEQNKTRPPQIARSVQGKRMLSEIAALTNKTNGLLQQIDTRFAQQKPKKVVALSEQMDLKQAFVAEGLGTDFSTYSIERAVQTLREHAHALEVAADAVNSVLSTKAG